ncbi:MAG: transposase, partial [Erythrobacter sp.]
HLPLGRLPHQVRRQAKGHAAGHAEFTRRFLIHVLSDGFHRIRHYGLLASSPRKTNIMRVRALLCASRPDQDTVSEPEAEIIPLALREPCSFYGGPMRIIDIF